MKGSGNFNSSNSNSSSAEAIFDQKIPSHSFQTEQHVRGRSEKSSRIVQSKIHPNGPDLALELKWVTKNFKPSDKKRSDKISLRRRRREQPIMMSMRR